MKLVFGVAQFVHVDRAGRIDDFRRWMSRTFPEREGKHVREFLFDDETGKLEAVVYDLRDGRPYWDDDHDGVATTVVPLDVDLPDYVREYMVPSIANLRRVL